MKGFTLLLLLTILVCTAEAQIANAIIENNNVRTIANSQGMLFNNLQQGSALFEVPKDGGVSTIYASQIWIAGTTSDQQIKLAAGTYNANGSDFFPGPLTDDGNATVDSLTMAHYNRMWQISSIEVQLHQSYFQSLLDGNTQQLFPNGYVIPMSFLEWPAHGNTQMNQAYYLAPFVDYDENGSYNPENGDYPFVCGDDNLYFIINDKGGPHTESDGQPIGVEIHVMLYEIASNDAALNNTVFVKYKIINRGAEPLNSAYLGVWTDLDIGNGSDDLIGCDVGRSAFYAYNGDANDQPSSSSLGYGLMTPSQSVQILAGATMDSDNLDNAMPSAIIGYDSYGPYAFGFNDGIVDNERKGMNSFVYYKIGANPINGDPNTPSDFLGYLRSVWKDGSDIYYGGTGVIGTAGVTDVPSAYLFPGSSDPYFIGTNGVEMEPWTESTAGNVPGDRRGLASCGPFTLEPGACHTLDLAFTYAEETGSGMSELEWLQHEMDLVKVYFNNNLIGCGVDCNPNIALALESEAEPNRITIAPNPADAFITINLNLQLLNAQLEIHDIAGKLVFSQAVTAGSNNINVSALEKGVYVVSLSGQNFNCATRLVIN
jgi:hypothetical protein